jgi:Mitochondrial ATP synthase B chain precursor (ATP-synt_B)
MMTFSRSAELTLGILACVVLSSKHIFIYNEETLVVLCFFGFLYTSVRLFGDSLTQSLNDRSATIALELRASLAAKEQFLRELLEEQKARLAFQTSMHALQAITHNELSSLQEQRQNALQATSLQQIHQKLSGLVREQLQASEKLQNQVSAGFRGSVLEEFHCSKKLLSPKLIQQSLQDLKI